MRLISGQRRATKGFVPSAFQLDRLVFIGFVSVVEAIGGPSWPWEAPTALGRVDQFQRQLDGRGKVIVVMRVKPCAYVAWAVPVDRAPAAGNRRRVEGFAPIEARAQPLPAMRLLPARQAWAGDRRFATPAHSAPIWNRAGPVRRPQTTGPANSASRNRRSSGGADAQPVLFHHRLPYQASTSIRLSLLRASTEVLQRGRRPGAVCFGVEPTGLRRGWRDSRSGYRLASLSQPSASRLRVSV